jgi:MFS family permease
MAGLVMAVIAIPPVFISPLSGWISDRIGNRIPMVVSCCFFTIAMFLISRLNTESTILHVLIAMAIFGTGMGIFNAPTQSTVINSAPRRQMSTALGVANMMRLLGSSVGAAFAGSLYAHQQDLARVKLASQGTAPGLLDQLSITQAFQYVILLAAFVSASAIITSALIGKSKPVDSN